MKDLLKFIKSSGIYFVGTVLTKLVSFLLLPLYTAYINPSDYGTYDLYNAYIMFFCSVLFLDIWAGIMRFMYDYKGDEKKKPISCGVTIFAGSSLLYTVLLVAIALILKVNNPFLLFLYGLLMNVQILIGYIARGYGKNVLYASGGLIGSIVTTVFNVVLLVYARMDYNALFIASCIGFAVNIAILLIGLRMPKIFSLKNFDKDLFKQMLRFSLPLCLNSVAFWFLTSYNKVAVSAVLGTEANGFYAIAGRFGSMITLFTTCFQMAWQELAFSKSAEDENVGTFYSTANNSYIKFMGAGLLLIIPAIYILYPIMVNVSYDEGKNLIPVYLFGTILASISSFLGNTFTAIKRTNLLFSSMLIGSVINVAAVHILLPYIGLQASNIALFLGFLGLCVSRIILLKKEIDLKIDYKSVGIIFISFIVVMLAYVKGNTIVNIIAILIACGVSAYMFRDILKQAYLKVKNR